MQETTLPTPIFRLNVVLSIKPERRDEFLDCIVQTQNETLVEAANVSYSFGEDAKTPNTFHFTESYIGKTGYEAHQKTSHFANWETFAASDPFSAEPIIHFYTEFVTQHKTLDHPVAKKNYRHYKKDIGCFTCFDNISARTVILVWFCFLGFGGILFSLVDGWIVSHKGHPKFLFDRGTVLQNKMQNDLLTTYRTNIYSFRQKCSAVASDLNSCDGEDDCARKQQIMNVCFGHFICPKTAAKFQEENNEETYVPLAVCIAKFRAEAKR